MPPTLPAAAPCAQHSCGCSCSPRSPASTSAGTDALPPKRTAGASTGAGLARTFSSTPAGAAPDKDILMLLEQNKAWVAEMKHLDPDFFTELGKGQSPKYLYFGCSDSRVPANEILGLKPGEVFVHRNVGNLVPGNDLNALSVLEFAVTRLDVRHIIVAGHYDCGAVHAAMRTQDLGLMENWLRLIRDVYRLHRTELDKLTNAVDLHRRLVELNVVEQVLNIYKTGVVQRRRIQTHRDPSVPYVYPRIHALTFDPSEGIMRKLEVNFEEKIGDLQHIYDLYHVHEHHDGKDSNEAPFIRSRVPPVSSVPVPGPDEVQGKKKSK